MGRTLPYVLIFCLVLLFKNNVSGQNCDLDPGIKGSTIFPKTNCAPVEVEFDIRYGDFPTVPEDHIQIYIDWGDGNSDLLPAVLNTGGAIPTWEVTGSHIYPKGGDHCNYYPTAILHVNNEFCFSSAQQQMVRVWDTDDENGGEMLINPVVEPICVGSDGTVTFRDQSQWNCVPPLEEDYKNRERRWIQWVYGTGGTSIGNAEVGGVVRAYPFEGPVEVTGTPIEGPVAPMNQSLEIYIPDYYEVGDYFEVTLRNWNQCNPWDQGFDPVETTAMAQIVALPDGSIAVAGPFCDNEERERLQPATLGGTWAGPGMSDPNSRWFDPGDAGPGEHTINYFVSDANGCSASGSVEIEVRESPVINLLKGDAYYLCPGISQELEVEILGGKDPLDILWTGDTSPLNDLSVEKPLFETTDIGLYNLTVTVSDDQNCNATDDMTIEVKPIEVSFNPPVVDVCQNQSIVLDPITNGGSTVFTIHEWTGDDLDKLSAANIANPVFNSGDTETYVYTYHVTDDMGCRNENDFTIIVKQQPVVSAGDNDEVCLLNYQLNGTSNPPVAGLWTRSDGPGTITFDDDTIAETSVTVSETGTYTFKWEVDLDGCVAEDETNIVFAEVPEPGIMDDFSICGLEGQLEAFPDEGLGQWNLVAGPGSASINDETAEMTAVSVSDPGEYSFRWTEITASQCIGHAAAEITFMPQAVAMVDQLPERGCSPYPVTFQNQSANADEYHWNLGGGVTSSETEPTFTYENLTNELRTYQITLTAKNSFNCNDSFTFPLEVAPSPRARALASPAAGCDPLPVSFTNTSTGATIFEWDFMDHSDINREINPEHTFENPENFVRSFPVKLYAKNDFGCADSTEIPVTVYPSLQIDLEANPDEGCSPLNVSFSATSGAVQYEWDFGDGTTHIDIRDVDHVYINQTNEVQHFHISVTGTNSFTCQATANTQISVYPSPLAQFDVDPLEMQMPEREITLTNLTEGDHWEFSWDMGDGINYTQSQPPDHAYTLSGSYTITLLAFSEWCSDMATREIIIHPMIPQILHYGNPASGCPPLTVTFDNQTLDATSYLWEFGDGRMSQEVTPEHTYWTPGTYQVTLTASGPGGTSVADDLEIVVFENPVALFEVNPKVIYIPDESPSFINRSIGATSWLWNFGDGVTSTDFSPSHQYTEPGVFDIALNVVNDEGCEDSYILREAVKVEQGGELVFPNAFTPNPHGPSDGRYLRGDRRNQVFYPSTQKGIWEYRLQIFTRWGELIFESNDVDIGWDGYHRTNLAPQGVYIYRVRYKTADGKVKIKSGDVTLIR